MIRVDIGDRADLIEVTSHRHHRKVLGGELDLRVIRVQLPVAHREPPCSPRPGCGTEYTAGCDRSWRHCRGRCQVRLGPSRSWPRSPWPQPCSMPALASRARGWQGTSAKDACVAYPSDSAWAR